MEAVTLGEFLAEFYRKKRDKPLYEIGDFRGPFPAGAPAIFADTLAKLGSSTGFIGVIGNDDFGRLAVERFENEGVNISNLRRMEDYSTGTSFVSYFKDGSRKFLFHLNHAAAGQLSPQDVDSSYISNAKFLHIAGSTLSINENCKEAVYKAVEIASENGLKITYDPNIRPELLEENTVREVSEPILESCDFLLPNKEEVKNLSKHQNLTSCAEEFLDYSMGAVVVKKGANGATIYSRDKELDVSSFQVKELDPTGAGDSFDAGFVYSILDGKDLEKAVKFANAVGALSVTERGGMGGIKDREDVLNLIED